MFLSNVVRLNKEAAVLQEVIAVDMVDHPIAPVVAEAAAEAVEEEVNNILQINQKSVTYISCAFFVLSFS